VSLALFGTPLSHFTRKVRIVLHEFAIPFEFQPVESLLTEEAGGYGFNPLMRIPTLVEGDLRLIESDYIARYLTETRAPHDPLDVLRPSYADLNRLAVINGIMAHEVTLLLAARGGLTEMGDSTYGHKLLCAIASGVAWLDGSIEAGRSSFNYVDVALISMWQHLRCYRNDTHLLAADRITERVARFSDRESVSCTAPQQSALKHDGETLSTNP
jgi:glutathione S-transferase